MDPACCLVCHLWFEENNLFAYLPARIAEKLKNEHRLLGLAGFPKRLVQKHAKREEFYFNQYCPQELLEQITLDHESFDQGKMPIFD